MEKQTRTAGGGRCSGPGTAAEALVAAGRVPREEPTLPAGAERVPAQ